MYILEIVVEIAICLYGILNQVVIRAVHLVKIHLGKVVIKYDFLETLWPI